MSTRERPLNRVIVQGGRVVRIEEWQLGKWSFWRWLINCEGRKAYRSLLMTRGPDQCECRARDEERNTEHDYSSSEETMEEVIRAVFGAGAQKHIKAFQMENADAVELYEMFPHHDVVFQP